MNEKEEEEHDQELSEIIHGQGHASATTPSRSTSVGLDQISYLSGPARTSISAVAALPSSKKRRHRGRQSKSKKSKGTSPGAQLGQIIYSKARDSVPSP